MELRNKSVLILGGDLRIIYLANILSAYNKVYVYGLESDKLNKDIINFNINREEFDIVIGPIPTTKGNTNLFAPTIEETINLVNILKTIKTKVFIGCKLGKEIIQILNDLGVSYIDILERDDFAIANALPTAEGAIQMAMENTPYILCGSKCLILGYGRCGKVLANMLQRIGAEVTVEARKTEDLEFIKCFGYKPLHLDRLREEIGNFDIIFNTVPYLLLNEEIIKRINKDSLIIDLASRPGGTDFEYAEKRGIKAILALGLPGKCAPKTAAEIILSSIKNSLSDI